MKTTKIQLHLVAEPASCLSEYGLIPIAFRVTERLVFRSKEEAGESIWRTHPVEPSYVKDYDRIPANRPVDWADRWDLTKWCFIAAFIAGQRVAGAAVILDPTEFEHTPTHPDVSVLWDVRVHPNSRCRGVGCALLTFAEEHARSRGIRGVKVETQDINVAACRLYARAGYRLVEINPCAYPEHPDEIQLIWQKDLASAP